jgi:hypothetical protein
MRSRRGCAQGRQAHRFGVGRARRLRSPSETVPPRIGATRAPRVGRALSPPLLPNPHTSFSRMMATMSAVAPARVSVRATPVARATVARPVKVRASASRVRARR